MKARSSASSDRTAPGRAPPSACCSGCCIPTAGAGRVLGLDIVRDSVAIRRRVGYLPGGIALYDSLTGERLLDYLAELSGRRAIRRAELCDRLELSSRTLRRLVRDYSRGMRQKIGIVQALQHDPELAILDEPTEGLDPLMQRAFYGILDTLKSEGRTIFFSSHVLSEVERVCDRVAIIRHGHLIATEEIAGLLARRKRNVDMRWMARRLDSTTCRACRASRPQAGVSPVGSRVICVPFLRRSRQRRSSI